MNSLHWYCYVCITYYFQGILPEILEELLAARKRAKADLKVLPNFFPRFLLDVSIRSTMFCSVFVRPFTL